MGENAIHKAAPFLHRLADMSPREVTEGPARYREVMSVTLAEGGTARNVVPDRFSLNVNFRFAPDRTEAEAESFLRSLIPGGARVQITDVAPAAAPRLDAPLLGAFRKIAGVEARAKQAWTDVARFARHGVAAANFGPGLPELAHRRDERIPVANLLRAYRVLSSFVGSRAPAEDSR
jgi:succinyl-diaminopimelate desuccinylase